MADPLLAAQIGQLANLQELELDCNQLMHLPAQLGQLAKLKKLVLDGNPLTSLPPEIVDLGTEAILGYLRAQMEQSQ